MTECIKGTCLIMCPDKERWMREREGLLHRFEIDESTKNRKLLKADPAKVVKSFFRPAAGQLMADADQLRPGPVLLQTIKYLFTNIVTKTEVNWVIIYDFVFDRLRAIRQDSTIQRINASMSIQLFEPHIRFLIYAAQRLCKRSISEFDAKINNQHISECIKHLLVLYDELDLIDTTELDKYMEKLSLNNNRSQMEAIYILLYMGDVNALNRALSLSPNLRKSQEITLAMKISLAWYLKNYVRVFSLIQQLPPILICAAMINLQDLRRTTLKIMSSGYNSKMHTFPGVKLQELLLYKDIAHVQIDCDLFGLYFNNQHVLFNKANFKDNVKLANPEMYFDPQTLQNFLPDILLGSIQ